MAGESDDDQQPSSLPAIFSEWGDLLHKIPGAAKAVTKLVGNAATAGSAWIDVVTAKGEQQAAEIRGVTDARKKVREAMTKAAVKQVGSDPDIGRRALEHFAEEIVSNQTNREAVTKGALQILAIEPPKEIPEREISDDWLRAFSIYAERASSEAVRAHWSAILAGEIRKPGSVSLMTIKMMSIIDVNGADLIRKYLKYIIKAQTSWCLPTVGNLNVEPAWDDILALDAIGFLKTGTNAINDRVFTSGRYRLEMVGSEFLLEDYYLPCSVLTQAGRELVALIGYDTSLEDAKWIRQEIVNFAELISFNIYDVDTNQLVSPASDYPSSPMRHQAAVAQAQKEQEQLLAAQAAQDLAKE